MSVTIWKYLKVDRIAMTVVIVSKVLYHQAESQLYTLKAKRPQFLPAGKIVVSQKKYLRRLDYYTAYGKPKASSRKIADITVGANKLFGGKSLHRYLTLTLYPSQFKAGDFETLKTALAEHMPEFSYSKLYQTAKVNYLELAADSLSQKHHSFLPYRKYCKLSSICKKNTIYIGSVFSGLRFRIYDKCKQLIAKGKPTFTTVLPHTRIEAAMRRLGVAATDLTKMKNPFETLQIADLGLALEASKDVGWQDFIADSLKVGVPRALSSRPDKRKAYLKILDDIQVSWWQPVNIWKHLPGALEKIAP